MIFGSRPFTTAWAVDYYRSEHLPAGDREAARAITRGAWQGRGAERLGLTGAAAAVERAAFLALLQGRCPFDGSDLLPPVARKLRRSVAWDFEASPDKSVSLVALLGPDPRIVEAHLDAAARALEVLEQQALAKHPVHRLVPTGNLVIARFDHGSSRALDPHLHSHHLIFNLTDRAGVQPRSVAGGRAPRAAGPARPHAEWRGLVIRGLYVAQPLASAVYEAELARGLQALGYELSANERGQVRILGIPDAALDAFSKRRRQVLALLARHDVVTAGSHRFARLSNRAAKLRHPDLAVLQSGWRAEADRLGVDVARLCRAADQRLASRRAGALPASGEPSERARAAVAWAVEWLGEREDAFRAMDLETLALRRAAAGGPRLDEIRAAIAAHPQVIRRDAYSWALGELPAAALTTTDSTIRIEVHNLALVRAGRLARGAPILTRPYAPAAGAGATLTPDQLHVARRILESRAAVLAVAGRPGPGKTAALAAVREAAAAAGWSIRACAATAGAKARLRQAGIETVSLQSLAPTIGPDAAEIGRPSPPSAPPGRLWIVDEAGLLSHRDAAAALDGARRAGARLVLIGERRRYRGDEAGRPWAAFQDAGLRPARLDPVRRPPDPELPRALQLAAAGRAGDAMRHLDAAGQVVEIAGARERHAAMVRELLVSAPGAGAAWNPRRLRDVLMIAPSPAERRELNALARRELVARGVVAPAGVTVEILVSKGLTEAQRGDPRRYEAGDVLTYDRLSRTHGTRRGETVRVVAVAAEPGRRIVTVARHRDGAVVEVDLRRVVGCDLARVESRELAAGDRVQFQRADRPRSIIRGALATVTVAAPERLVLLLDPSLARASPRVVTLEPGNAPLALDHGYAIPPPVTDRRTVVAVRVLAAIDTRHGPELVNRRQALVTVARASHRLTVFTDDRAALPAAVDRRPAASPRQLRQMKWRDRHAVAAPSRDAAAPVEPPGRTEGIRSGHARRRALAAAAPARRDALAAAAPARRDRARAGRGADRAQRPRDPLPRHGAERSAREAARPHGAALRGRRPGVAAERDSPLRRLGAALDPGDSRPGLSAGDRARSAAPSLAQQLIAAAERWQDTRAARAPLDRLLHPRRPAAAALSPLYRIEDPERQLVRLVERLGPARALAILPPALARDVLGLREVARLLDGPSLGR